MRWRPHTSRAITCVDATGRDAMGKCADSQGYSAATAVKANLLACRAHLSLEEEDKNDRQPDQQCTMVDARSRGAGKNKDRPERAERGRERIICSLQMVLHFEDHKCKASRRRCNYGAFEVKAQHRDLSLVLAFVARDPACNPRERGSRRCRVKPHKPVGWRPVPCHQGSRSLSGVSALVRRPRPRAS